MKIAVVGVPGAWSTEELATALRRAGAEATVVDLAACHLALPDRRLFHQGRPLTNLAGAIVKKVGDAADGPVVHDRLNLLRHLEASGVPVLSSPDRLEAALNRYRMTVELARAGVPIPDTMITEDPREAAAAVEGFGAAVLKPLYTSKGRGMERLDARLDLPSLFEKRRQEGVRPFYLQRFVEHRGRDLGVALLEGDIIGAYWRIARDDQWMTTILSGGRYAPAELPAPAAAIARRAARHFGLFFTGVDLVEGSRGFEVLEVSAFGGFRGLRDACGVDAAVRMAGAAIRRLRALPAAHSDTA